MKKITKKIYKKCRYLICAVLALLIFTKKIVESNSKVFKAICYYTTIAFMLLDPIYLTVLYKFVGGGDMNGIILFGMSETILQIIFGIIAAINLFLIIKKVYPAYKKSFNLASVV